MTKDTDHSFCFDMEVMQPFQKDLLSKFDGYKPGEMMFISASRGTGKSQLNQYMATWDSIFKAQPEFASVANAMVDGEPWHTVQCTVAVSSWVRTMNKKEWYEHIDQHGYINKNIFDMSERLYLMLAMKFS